MIGLKSCGMPRKRIQLGFRLFPSSRNVLDRFLSDVHFCAKPHHTSGCFCTSAVILIQHAGTPLALLQIYSFASHMPM